MKKLFFLIFFSALVLSSCGQKNTPSVSVPPTSPSTFNFNGDWGWRDQTSSLILKLYYDPKDGSLTGFHSASSNDGSKEDVVTTETGANFPSIEGTVSGNIATVTIKSGHSVAQARAQITANPDAQTLNWKITGWDVEDTNYIPKSAILHRVEYAVADTKDTDAMVDSINSVIATKKLKPAELSLSGSSEGGSLLIYQDSSVLLKYKAIYYGDMGRKEDEFYFGQNQALLFVSQTYFGYEPNGTRKVVSESKDKFYFDPNGQLTLHLNPDNKPQSLDDPGTKEAVTAIFKDLATFKTMK